MTAGRTNHTAFSSASNTDSAEVREHRERLLALQGVMGCHAPNLFGVYTSPQCEDFADTDFDEEE